MAVSINLEELVMGSNANIAPNQDILKKIVGPSIQTKNQTTTKAAHWQATAAEEQNLKRNAHNAA